MNFPSDLKYTKDHAWVRREGNTATVGITDFAQRELSDIVYVEVETVGETLPQDTNSQARGGEYRPLWRRLDDTDSNECP